MEGEFFYFSQKGEGSIFPITVEGLVKLEHVVKKGGITYLHSYYPLYCFLSV